MSCYHPLLCLDLGIKPNGKHNIKIIGNQNADAYGSTGNRNYNEDLKNAKLIKIKCGKCIGCRLDYARHWADRMSLEAKQYKNNIFLTLTYNDEYLRSKKNIHSLDKRDIQLFIKRLRKELKNEKIKYYAAGEYGETTARPHYHICIFNITLKDLTLLYTKNGFNYWTSETINKLWTYENKKGIWQSKGNHIIGEFTYDTASYTARYIMKKQLGNSKQYYKKMNIEPEFCIMSNGIGKKYYQNNLQSIYEYDKMYLTKRKGNKEIAYVAQPPKYYDELLQKESICQYEKIKKQRLENAQRKKITNTSQTLQDYFITCEEIAQNNLIKKYL